MVQFCHERISFKTVEEGLVGGNRRGNLVHHSDHFANKAAEKGTENRY